MTSELRRQHDGLTAASDLIDRRRRFTEAVLSGVSAGVIGLDGRGVITIVNPSAEALLGAARDDARRRADRRRGAGDRDRCSRSCSARASGSPSSRSSSCATTASAPSTCGSRASRREARTRASSSRSTTSPTSSRAQRTSAWADVARRIAHEIKNPLTPIQLSAERIRRKYGKVITTRPRGLRPVHDDDRAPGRRHQAHGRRVLVLRPHAEADDRAARTSSRPSGTCSS